MPSETVRLQKYIADQGIASRRAAEAMIEEGRLTVNGKVAVLGTKVVPGQDEVRFDGKQVRAKRNKKSIVLALHKPTGVLCSNADPHDQRTVFKMMPPPFDRERLFCAGRLDKESEGLVILTNDGALAQKLTHPSNRIVKRYRVTLNRDFEEQDIPKLLEGVTWEGERLKVEKVVPLSRGTDHTTVEVHMGHGKKREIRRLFLAFDYRVKRLVRFQVGGFLLKGIPRGRTRVLNKADIARLFD